MLRKSKILPKLAMTGVMKNGTVYFPYMGAGVFAAFAFFVFSSILHNDIISSLPKSQYAWILLFTGQILLGIIIVPFLFYTNSFLIKRRKREIGLYSILGLEKKHISIMMLIETLFLYFIVVAGGIAVGTVFSKLIFLMLLNMTGLPVDAEFVFTKKAFLEVMLFFGAVYLLNFLYNIIEVYKARPVELLSGSKKGEKEPKHILLPTIIGIAALGWGYYIASTAQIDSNIFTNFFLAIFLVVIGTYFLFTAGSIVFLRILKRNKKIYYRSHNFITVSGMLYRMKKNAVSLVNICIFATMVIITLTCTLSLYRGSEQMVQFLYPYDVELRFAMHNSLENEAAAGQIERLENAHGVEAEEIIYFPHYLLNYEQIGSTFAPAQAGAFGNAYHEVGFMALDDYNRLSGTNQTLERKEALMFSTGPNLELDSIELPNGEFVVKEELFELKGREKDEADSYLSEYYMIVKDEQTVLECVDAWKVENGIQSVSGSYHVYLMLEGEQDSREAFMAELDAWSSKQEGFQSFHNNFFERENVRSMYGGLLFIGIIFSVVFMMCLLLIMYYKQVVEGYEDRDSFMIMKKVGMSDKEIKYTIGKQILLVFFLPLFGAVCHTMAGIPMVNELFGVIRLYAKPLVMQSAIIVMLIFVLCYGISYLITAKAYYRIIK